MDTLISALEREITQRGSQRRVLNLIDNARGAIAEVEAEFRTASGRLAESADVGQHEADEFKARLGRVINDKLIEGKSRINDLIDRRRSWHVTADLSGHVVGDWAGETKALHSELEQQLEELDGELRGLFEDEVEAFVEDWTLPQSDHTSHVSRKDVSAAANRAAKLAARVGPTVVGVVAIAIASNPVGWTIAGVSTAVGLVLNKYALPTGGWIDRLVPSRRERMNVFRSELSRQTRQELDELAEQVAAHWHERVDEYVRMANAGANDMACRAADDASLSVRLATHATDLSCLVMDLDAQLTRAVLQLEGRHRLAEGVSVVHRLPGRASAVGTANGANAEFCLFPPGMAPELLASFADATDRAPVFRAADVISGFLTPPVVTRRTGPGLDFVGEHLRGPLPKELVEKLASAASGTEVRVTVRGRSNGGSDEERAPCPSAAGPGA
jgi:lysozyme family protein